MSTATDISDGAACSWYEGPVCQIRLCNPVIIGNVEICLEGRGCICSVRIIERRSKLRFLKGWHRRHLTRIEDRKEWKCIDFNTKGNGEHYQRQWKEGAHAGDEREPVKQFAGREAVHLSDKHIRCLRLDPFDWIGANPEKTQACQSDFV